MFIWKVDYQRLIDQLVVAKTDAAKTEMGCTMLREQCALLQHSLELAEARNQEIFDAFLQIKHEHQGTGYQSALKQMFQDGETLMEEDPEQLKLYHARMQELQDQGMDPGLVLLEDVDDLRREDELYGTGSPEGS